MSALDMGIVIFGSGGQAKVVLSTLIALDAEVLGLLDDNHERLGEKVLGYPIIGDQSWLRANRHVQAICALGDNTMREKVTQAHQVDWISVVHPRAYVHESVRIGVGTVIFAGAVIQPDVLIGDHVIINTMASVDHDSVIGNCCHIAPGSHLGGGVEVGNGTFLGIGCKVKPYTKIGRQSILGAGSVVVKDIPDFVYAKGVPAAAYKKV